MGEKLAFGLLLFAAARREEDGFARWLLFGVGLVFLAGFALDGVVITRTGHG